MQTNKHNKELFKAFRNHYPTSKTTLKYSNNWELLVSVILSAQCTDARVNIVTKKLFKKYKTVEKYANADVQEFEQDIRSTGFYRNKAKNIINTAKLIVNDYHGNVPDTMENLLKLHGVARKTANVVLGNAFGKYYGIAVDTHVKRLAERLGLSKEKTPEKIEKDLMKQFKGKDGFDLTYLLIEHGRAICDARKPLCDKCFWNKKCPSAFKFKYFDDN